MLKHHSHNPAATKIIWSGRGLLNIVNLGPLDEDLEALTHWHDEGNAFLESQHYFQGYFCHTKMQGASSEIIPTQFE